MLWLLFHSSATQNYTVSTILFENIRSIKTDQKHVPMNTYLGYFFQLLILEFALQVIEARY